MSAPDLPAMIEMGKLFGVTKTFMIAVHGMWIYDYFITLGDEIKYAWSGKKSWIFVLFLANRYIPVIYIVWINVIMFHYNHSLCVSIPLTHYIPQPAQQLDSCQATKWIATFHTSAVTVAAQITVGLRVYAVTRRNKLFDGALCALIAAQIIFGAYSVIRIAIGPTLVLPDIDLEEYKVCLYARFRIGELLYSNLTVAFDLLAFVILVTAINGTKATRYPGVPSVLDAILRDATVYFALIFASQLLFQLFLFLAPTNIQILPGIASALFIPIMATRLMLSLKKAAVKPKGGWSLTTMTNTGKGKLQQDGTPHSTESTLRVLDGSHETSATSTLPNEEDIELKSTPRLHQNHESPC